jgi:hypothetical protein
MTLSELGLPTAPKLRGEIAEARFIAKALSLGFSVLKPFGDSQPYDFILQFHQHFCRIQVKSAWALNRDHYCINSNKYGRGKYRPYEVGDIDFIAAYIAPLDMWYIIPLAAILPRGQFAITPGERCLFHAFREAWDLLLKPRSAD